MQELTIDCRLCLAFTPGALALLARGGLRSLTLSCGRLGADTLQHLGCLSGLTQLQVISDNVRAPGGANADGGGAALRHLTALSGLTQLVHLHVELGRKGVEEYEGLPLASELLAALPRAPLEKVGRPGHHLVVVCCTSY
jgi:hypothetical protein